MPPAPCRRGAPPAFVDPLRLGVDTRVHASFHQRAVLGVAEPLGQFRQQAVDVLQQGEFHFARRDARVVRCDVAQAVGERTRRFHPGEPAAYHDEVTRALPQQWIGLELKTSKPPQYEVAQALRIANRLERQSMLCGTRDHVEARAQPECEHDMFVRKHAGPSESCAGDRSRCEVDARHPSHDEAGATHHLANGGDDLLGEHAGAHHLGQHGREGRVALLADQEQLVAEG